MMIGRGLASERLPVALLSVGVGVGVGVGGWVIKCMLVRV